MDKEPRSLHMDLHDLFHKLDTERNVRRLHLAIMLIHGAIVVAHGAAMLAAL